ncbi:hypothetical protein E3N88_01656 [Mikania micrantha]|uniref:Dof zinc finger protein n=1 Tax=Mikania micrantha TaxID=192012 RepID=A0A5N6Q4A9_9ASTR|nr:hypothetical protein E3N88_01656 [Mikania micrantha]
MKSNNIASKQENKNEGQSMDGVSDRTGGRNASSLRPPEQILKCPRCDSLNTKFCYYNNYSLAQPRHYCKACRRYWTKGGTLRNVPVGCSCRKNKKIKSCSSKFFSGESSSTCFGLSTLNFQLGELNLPPRVTTANTFSSSYGGISSNHSLASLDPLGYNLPFSSSHTMMKQGHQQHQQQQQQQHNRNEGELGSFHEMGRSSNHDLHHNSNLASSIESLSSINQDLHCKLQQQRLAMLFGGGGENNEQHQKKQTVIEPHHQRLQPILFQNLETSKSLKSSMDGDPKKDTDAGGCNILTEWFFDNNYAPDQNLNPDASTSSNVAVNGQTGSMNNWNGIEAWNHLNRYSS